MGGCLFVCNRYLWEVKPCPDMHMSGLRIPDPSRNPDPNCNPNPDQDTHYHTQCARVAAIFASLTPYVCIPYIV